MSEPKLSNVSSPYGAPMGRREHHGGLTARRLYLQRVRLDSGGYDNGGAYWGIGQTLWHAFDGENVELWFRASSREKAKAHVLTQYKSARFYR